MRPAVSLSTRYTFRFHRMNVWRPRSALSSTNRGAEPPNNCISATVFVPRGAFDGLTLGFPTRTRFPFLRITRCGPPCCNRATDFDTNRPPSSRMYSRPPFFSTVNLPARASACARARALETKRPSASRAGPTSFRLALGGMATFRRLPRSGTGRTSPYWACPCP